MIARPLKASRPRHLMVASLRAGGGAVAAAMAVNRLALRGQTRAIVSPSRRPIKRRVLAPGRPVSEYRKWNSGGGGPDESQEGEGVGDARRIRAGE